MADSTVTVPLNTVIILSGAPYQLRWDKGAIFRCDDLGLFGKRPKGSIGFAQAAKYVWAMLPKEGREKFSDPEAVALALPPLAEAWPIIENAQAVAGEDAKAKNVLGSTNGPSPASG